MTNIIPSGLKWIEINSDYELIYVIFAKEMWLYENDPVIIFCEIHINDYDKDIVLYC